MADPERNMIVVAVLLAILEKFTSMLGKLNFIWATTVLLGGFASDLAEEDFLYVSVILVVEGIRIFGRRGELHTSYSPVPFVIKYNSLLIQDWSAGTFLYLSSYRLADYGGATGNQNVALQFFYVVSFVESALILLGLFLRMMSGASGRAARIHPISQGKSPISQGKPPIFRWISRWFCRARWISRWVWEVRWISRWFCRARWITRWVCEVKEGFCRARSRSRWFCRGTWESRWVLEVKEEYNLDDSQIFPLYRFLHYTYCRCVCGSIFDSSKITIVSYSVELLQASNGDEQLEGARLLSGLVKENPRALERLRSIGTIRGVVEMLIDMLNWDWNEFPELRWERIEIREAAAEIISNLVKIGRNRTLVMAAPNSMESIASLLDDGNQVEINSSQNRTQSLPEYPYSNLSKVGLCILKQLANDHDNRARMGSNRGLLLKIIALTESNDPDQLHLKMLAIETLTSIARDQDFREIVGCIDGVLHNFFSLFLHMKIGNEELVSKAGEALGFLSLDSNQNCEIMKSIRRAYFRNLIPRLISLLNEEVRGTYAARILRNLSAFLDANSVELNMIRAAAVQVVDLVTEKEGVHQEAAIGLAAQIFKFLSQADYDLIIGELRARSLISTLLDVLRQKASKELPNIRRFSILLLIAVMRKGILLTIRNESQIKMDLRNALEGAMDTSVLESYSTLSGGLRSDSTAIPFLAQSAMELLDK